MISRSHAKIGAGAQGKGEGESGGCNTEEKPEQEEVIVDYFKRLRRKIGVVTLLVACGFATVWIFTFARIHVVMIRNVCVVTSENGEFTISKTVTTSHKTNTGSLLRNRFSPSAPDQLIKMYDFLPNSTQVEKTGLLTIPYWSLVIPLTLLSACLLLSKPRAGSSGRKIGSAI